VEGPLLESQYRAVLQLAGARYVAQYIQIEIFREACSFKVPHTEPYCSLQVARVWHSRTKYHFLQPTSVKGIAQCHKALLQPTGVKSLEQCVWRV